MLLACLGGGGRRKGRNIKKYKIKTLKQGFNAIIALYKAPFSTPFKPPKKKRKTKRNKEKMALE